MNRKSFIEDDAKCIMQYNASVVFPFREGIGAAEK